MKKQNSNTKHVNIYIRNRSGTNILKILCWSILPVFVIIFIILDALGIYPLSTERLIALGVVLIVALLPFVSEITIKNLTIKPLDNNKK